MTEEIKYNFIVEINECNICYENHHEFLNVIDVHFYVVQNALIISFLLIIIIVLFADIKK